MSVDLSANDLMASSLRLIGVLGQGETMQPGDASAAFLVLNSLIDHWETLHLTALTRARYVDDLVASQASYTIGPSGDLDHARPTDILGISLIRTELDPTREEPLTKLTHAMWMALPDKDQTASEPVAFYYEPDGPDGTIYLYPVPDNATNDLAIYVRTPLAQFENRDQAVTLPPGYAKALRFNLAVDLATEFGKPLDPQIKETAKDTLGDLKRQNVRMDDLSLPAGFGGEGGFYDIYGDR